MQYDLTPGLEWILSFGYTAKDIFMALAAMVASAAFLYALIRVFFGSFLWTPTSVRHVHDESDSESESWTKRKVVLVLAADQEIGFRIMEQYVQEPDVTVVAASASIEKVDKWGAKLDLKRAVVAWAEVDAVRSSEEEVATKIKELDVLYGPVTHFYDLTGATGLCASASEKVKTADSSNVQGCTSAIQAAFDLMRPRHHGKIFILSSTSYLCLPIILLFDLSCNHAEVTVADQPRFFDPAEARQKQMEEKVEPQVMRGAAERLAKRVKELDEPTVSGGLRGWALIRSFIRGGYFSSF
ncbi:hypothetical protein CPB84DRAFT_215264 [Gymnopilus junonius]|uniref:Uncharacterized protein n=1 Tax=Gymnopilus junonius TaxID=109634 RepID=A0A9P5NGU4_GYMJU|nr:hypothetical protein CPB84DRAFT_215264 [Gymnopilus junonius]